MQLKTTVHPKLKRYLTCELCRSLSKYRRNVVPGIGDIPAKILFIEEAPGKTEDLLGELFIGKYGQLFRQAIKDATKLLLWKHPPSYFVTSVLACRPTDKFMGDSRQPTASEIARCRPRLVRTVALVRPERVVLLGDVADHEARRVCPDGVKVRHPAYVDRRGGIGGVDYRIFVRALTDVFASL